MLPGIISVVIPTVTGREELFENCVRAYMATTQHRLEFHIYYDQPTCGKAWIKGAQEATGEYVHFTADDLEPHEGWDVAAVEAVDRDIYPVAALNKDTTALLAADWQLTDARSTVPFLSREMLDAALPLFDGHYYTDDWIDWRLRNAGYATAYRRDYRFTHYRASAKRGAGMTEQERMAFDHSRYIEAQARI